MIFQVSYDPAFSRFLPAFCPLFEKSLAKTFLANEIGRNLMFWGEIEQLFYANKKYFNKSNVEKFLTHFLQKVGERLNNDSTQIIGVSTNPM